MDRFLNFVSITINTLALLAVIWIIVPAPSYYVWLFSVAAGEWSLWFGALALLGIVCGVVARVFYRNGNLWFISLIIGCIAFIISLYPLLSVMSAAREQNVSLSPKQYFSGLSGINNDSESKKEDFTTYTFARIDETELKLNVYLPPDDAIKNGAGVIVVHGGSWNGGGRSDFPQWNRWLAREGFTVFDIDYRLAPQPNWQTATGDVKCAVRWVKEHAAEFKISPERIALLGRSAGAHLALLSTYSADDTRLPASCVEKETKETNENVRAVVSFYAPTDLVWAYDNPANEFVINGRAVLADFLGGNPHESDEIRERFILASPVAHVSSNTVPTLLIHGGQDQLVRSVNMYLLADKLKEANVPHEVLFIPYAQHGFDYNFNGWGAQVVKPVIVEFLRENTKVK
ncbi:MAG: alpha/beta hydrolase [Pyrinomonadaceae bacterium]